MTDKKAYKVLIIDDNPEFVRFLKKILTGVCGSVIESIDYALNANEGLMMIRDQTYHFVFMDIDMPGIDGITATRFASFEYANPQTKIIAISFHTEQTYRTQMLRAGATQYLAKDEIEADQLAEIFGI